MSALCEKNCPCEFCGVLQLVEKLPYASPTQETKRLPSTYGTSSRGGQILTPGVFLRPQTTTRHLKQNYRVRGCDGFGLVVPTNIYRSPGFIISSGVLAGPGNSVLPTTDVGRI